MKHRFLTLAGLKVYRVRGGPPVVLARDVEDLLNKRCGVPRIHGLTHRQWAVLNLVCKGHFNRQIADLLFVTEKAVKWQINLIYKTTHARSRVDLIKWAAHVRMYGRPPE